MPERAPTACRKPGCPGLVRAGVCSVCGPLRRHAQAAYDAQRGTAAQRGYDARWQRLRLAFLAAHPFCAACAQAGRVEPATDVHHITPRRDRGADAEENLQALCHRCHSRITAAGG
jgi:5-methylcytosine-specific restriction protein A